MRGRTKIVPKGLQKRSFGDNSMRIAMAMCLLFLFTVTTTQAQTAFPALGGEADGSNGSLSYTMGQVETQDIYAPITNAEITGAILCEGVQQTYKNSELGIEEITPVDFSIAVYPNPTAAGYVTVELTQSCADTRYELYASNGKLTQSGTLPSTKQKIDLTRCNAGTYVLKIYDSESGRTNSFRIIKLR